MRKGILSVAVISLVYLLFTVGFNLLPRTTYSELEKRDLQRFPHLTLDSLADGSYTAAISSWYSDTEPYRDTLMELSMQFRHLLGLRLGESHIEYLSGDRDLTEEGPAEEEPAEKDPAKASDDTVKTVKAFDYADVEGGRRISPKWLRRASSWSAAAKTCAP